MKKTIFIFFLTLMFASYSLQAQFVSSKQQPLAVKSLQVQNDDVSINRQLEKYLRAKEASQFMKTPQKTRSLRSPAYNPVYSAPTANTIRLGGIMSSEPRDAFYGDIENDSLKSLTSYSTLFSYEGHPSTLYSYILPRWAVWTGTILYGSFKDHMPAYGFSSDFGYCSYDPTLDALIVNNSAYLMTDVKDGVAATYNPIDKKVYGITKDYLSLFAGDPISGDIRKVGPIKFGTSTIGSAQKARAIAASNDGRLFLILNDGGLYSMDIAANKVSFIGSTGQTFNAAKDSTQHMTFDIPTNTLYWAAHVGSANTKKLFVVDTATAKVKEVKGNFPDVNIFFSHHYTEILPGNDPLYTVSSSIKDPLIASFSFKAPTLANNGEVFDNLEKAIFYVKRFGEWKAIDSMSVEAGKVYAREIYKVGAEGQYTFGLSFKDKAGKEGTILGTIIDMFNVSLPYSNGFESKQSNFSVTGYSGHRLVNSADTAYQGDFCYEIKGFSSDFLNFVSFPVKKGASYELSCYAKSYEMGDVDLAFYINGEELYPYYSTTTTYKKYQRNYLAEKDGYISFSITSNKSAMNGSPLYIDNVAVVETLSSSVPNKVDSLEVKHNTAGLLKYDLSWKNPMIDMGDNPLSDLTKVIVEWCTEDNFTASTFGVDTVRTTDLGAKLNKEIVVEKAGSYYFRLTTVNSKGISPNPLITKVQNYVGRDTIPAAVTGEVTQANNDGTINVSFNKHAEVGTNGGFLDGTITNYRVIRSLYYSSAAAVAVKDTMFTTNTSFQTEALPIGYYIFQIAAIRNNMNVGTSTSAYSVGGIMQNQKLVQEGVLKTTTVTNSQPLYFSNSISANSSFSQVIYTPAEMGGPCLIDTIFLFVQNLPAAQLQKIYIGTVQDTMFKSTTAYMDISKMKLVFNDTIKNDKYSNVLAIKVDLFAYNGKEPLVITFVKPKQPRQILTGAAPSIIQMNVPNRRMLSIFHTSLDFDINSPTIAGTLATTRPITVLNKMKSSASISGFVKNSAGVAISNAKVIVKKGEDVFINTTTSADGKYFVYLPANTYTIQVSSIMMSEYTSEIVLTAGEAKTLDITLTDAGRISLTGFIKNYKNEFLEGVAITLAGDTTYNTVSNAQGKFVIENMYGVTTYNLTAKKSGYNNYTKAVKLEDKDFEMDTIKLDFDPTPVVGVQASQTNNIATITWSNPGGAKLLSWCKDSTKTNSIGAGSGKILIAQTFNVADLAAAGAVGTTGKITKVKFKANDVTASFTLKIFQGTNPVETSAIYTQEIGKVTVGSHEITLTTPCVVDASKDLYIAFELAAGYTGFPMGCDEGPIVPGKGGRIYSSGSWGDLPANLPYNWTIYTTLSIEVPNNNPVGYHVYRGISGSESSVDTWSKLNSTMLTTFTYTDNTFAALPFGQYKYAVKADWMNDNLSPATISNIVNKDMEFKVETQVNTNGAPKTGAKVTLSNVNGSESNIYTIDAPASGLVSFPKIWRGIYNVMVTLPGHTAIEVKNVNIAKDTNLALPSLIEIISDPNITEATVTDNAVLMNWSILPEGSWSDNFESYEDFAIANIGDYILSSPVKKGGMQNVSWKNVDEKQSYIVMNPNKTTPSLNPSYAAHSGNKCLAAWYATSPPNNDWLIRSVTATNGGKLSFYARGLGLDGVPESFRVLASTKTSASADFVKLHTATSIAATTTWAQYTYDVPAGAKFIAINCTSNDLFGFFVDDLSFSLGAPANPKSYEIYLDGTKVADTVNTVSKYLFKNLSPGAHIVGIKAIYYSGASTLVTEKIIIANVTKPINPSVSMHEGNAVFTWDIPSGYTPTAYEVYLDGTKVTDVTAKTYTFMNPSIGEHTAGVIAVFGSEKSAMTTANFKVVRIDDVAANAGINVYPNPSSTGQFNLSVESSYEVSVLQYNGKVVMSKKVTAGESVIDLSNQPQGVYFIKLTSVEGSYTVKIVK